MKKFIAALLAAVTVLSLFACGPGGGSDTGTGSGGDTSGAPDDTNANVLSEAPAWPEATVPEPMEFPEPNGDAAYRKINVTADMITSSTPWNNGSDVAANAFDGNASTFFDGVENGWIKVDLGERVLVGKLGFTPRGDGYEGRLNGTFYGSVDGVVWTQIYDIKTAPRRKTTVDYTKFDNVAAFRYIKYENTRDCANIAEMEIYSAVNIPTDLIIEPERESYADGSYEDFKLIPEDRGMTKLTVTSSDAALVDNNPSTLASSTSEAKVSLGGTYPVGCIAFISDSSSVGGKFYGVKPDGSRDLIAEITEAPTARVSEFLIYGEMATTGNYTDIVFEKAGACNLAEIRVYAMEHDTTLPIAALPFAMGDVSGRTAKVGDVNCVALNWGSELAADKYDVYRDGELVATCTGTSWQDYGVALGDHEYSIGLVYGKTTIKSEAVTATCRKLPECELYTINNQTGTSLHTQSEMYDGNKYYSYSVNVQNGQASVVERSSDDGYNFNSSRVVLDSSAHKLMASCKIESVKTVYVKSQNKVVIAAHWEKPNGYADGKLFLVTGTPGGEFKVCNIWNPLGVEVRDMSIFVDDDDTAYLLAAANKPGVDSGANATTYVFKFSEDYSDIAEVTARLFPEMYREMPNIVKIDGLYYLFVSQTAGWAPTQGAYAVSDNIKEGWSELRTIGNSSTFGSQSSWILKIGDGEDAHYIMHAYRWGPAQGIIKSDTMLAPIVFSNGYAYYDYYPEILYNSETGDMIPVTYGKLLSQDAKATATVPASDDGAPENMVDGDYNTAYVAGSNKWPFTVEIDLGRECNITNIQASLMLYKGSEGFYRYKLYGSTDGDNWDMIEDAADLNSTKVTKTLGFISIVTEGSYRYLKLEVLEARRWKDSSWDATSVYGESLTWYTPTVYEFRVYGTEK